MKPIVVRSILRADESVIVGLGSLGVSTVHEAMGRSGLLRPYMRPIWPGAQVSGSAVTVLAQPGDNWMLHVAVEQCQRGDCLVVAVAADNTDGMFGELLATSLQARGVVGLVIDAGCRDVRALSQMRFPVWSRAISARGTVKATLGAVNIPVICAGAAISPGDVVIADDDGVVVVPRRDAPAVAAAAFKRRDEEETKRTRFAEGELGLDVYDMRGKLARAGLRYVNEIEDIEASS